MNRLFLTLGVAAAFAIVGFCGQTSAGTIPYAYNPAVPIFNYHFDESSSNLSTGTVLDLSTAGFDGTPTGFPSTGLSSDVPDGMTGYSIDAGLYTDFRGIRTDVLEPDTGGSEGGFVWDVYNGGGFVMDVYFKANNVGSGIRSILSLGSNHLRVRDRVIRYNIQNSTNTQHNIATGWSAETDTWYHAVAIFESGEDEPYTFMWGGIPEWRLQGDMYLYVDDELIGSWVDEPITCIFDRKHFPISIGTHPTSDTDYMFGGLIYNPKASFLVPEPGALSLLAMGFLGLICHAWRRRK